MSVRNTKTANYVCKEYSLESNLVLAANGGVCTDWTTCLQETIASEHMRRT